MQIEITVLASVFGVVIAVGTFFFGRVTAAQKSGESAGEFRSDIQYVKRLLEDMLLEQRNTNKTVADHGERLAKVEERTASALKRIDDEISKQRQSVRDKE